MKEYIVSGVWTNNECDPIVFNTQFFIDWLYKRNLNKEITNFAVDGDFFDDCYMVTVDANNNAGTVVLEIVKDKAKLNKILSIIGKSY